VPAESLAPAVDVAAARPLFLDARADEARRIFAWHHAPASNVRRGAAVILCPPLGYEYMSSYRTLRLVAERLAALGFDSIRFDYEGTGNSTGDALEANRVAAWIRSVDTATREARRLCGSSQIAVIGLRAGALLALQSIPAIGTVDRLVLWNPFASGRAYVRELKATARLSESADDQLDAVVTADEQLLNAEGHVFTTETLDALSRWTVDLLASRPARDVLVIERDDRPAESALDTRLQQLGARVDKLRTSGTAEMLAPPHLARIPEQTVDAIADWMANWRPSPSPQRTNAEATASAEAIEAHYREQAVRFGPGERLFGLLSTPRSRQPSMSSILLLTTGAGHHVGPHRLYVPLSRDFASRGHVVFRFDLGGVGDSDGPQNTPRSGNVAYPAHMLDDAREAVALLRKQAPESEVVVVGLCSGGWLAFRAAREGLDVDAIVSVNPPLYLRDGAAGQAWLAQGRELERYKQSMSDPGKWIKALRGGASYASFTRIAAGALARRVATRVSGVFTDALPDGLAHDLCTVAGRGVRTLLIFSRGDTGLAYFQAHAQPALRRPEVLRLVRHVIVDGAGHAFRPLSAQRTLRELLSDFVTD